MNIIHNNNHTKFSRRCVINSNDCIIDHPGFLKFPKIFRDLNAGIHRLVFKDYPDKIFYMNVYTNIGPGESITINNLEHAFYNSGNGIYPVQLYESCKGCDLEPVLIYNTLNDHIDIIAINGETIIKGDEFSLDSPRKLKFIDKIHMTTWDNNVSNADSVTFDLRHNIRRLPSGIMDQFVLDAENQRAYILYRTGHYAITGLEEIQKVDTFSNEKFSVYFIKNENVKRTGYGKDLICTHFKSVNYEAFRKMEFEDNSICISDDDWRGRGFYIKISNDIAPDMESFINLINSNFKEHQIEVVFPLVSQYQSNVLLDDYCIKTFLGSTYIECDEVLEFTYFYKTSLF
jgi:hypothetical protein